MARVAIPISWFRGPVGNAYTEILRVTTDSVNNHEWVFRDGDILWARALSGSTGIQLMGASNVLERTANALQTVVSGNPSLENLFFGPLRFSNWLQPDGKAYVDVDTTTASLSVLRLK